MTQDIIVIGSGEMALFTAIEGAMRGLDVLMVENVSGGSGEFAQRASLLRSKIGKAVLHELASRELLVERPGPAAGPLLRHGMVRELSRQIGDGCRPPGSHRLFERRIRLIAGSPRFVSSRELLLEPHGVLTAPIIVIATGSRPRHPTRFAFDQQVICDYDNVLAFERLPRHLLIVGAEALGLEVACIFRALGSGVTLLDRRRQTLRQVDRQLRKALETRLHSMGIEVVLGEKLSEVQIRGPRGLPRAQVTLSSGRVETCDRVLIDAGNSANTEDLGLANAGIRTDHSGFISIDQYNQTSQPGVYAVGDVVGNCCPVDARQSRRAIQHALREQVDLLEVTPCSIHTTPPISTLGLNEDMCQRMNSSHVVGIAHYSDLPALALSAADDGMLKLVFSRDDRRLMGVHAVGDGATELAHFGAVFVSTGGCIDELACLPVVAHSLFEAFPVAAQDALQRLTPAQPRRSKRSLSPSPDG